MWKKIFAASLLASVSSVLFLGSSDVSAAIVAPMPYEPGDWIGSYGGNVNVCASGSDSYSLSETPLVADIQYADVSTQIVFNSNSPCRRFEGVSSLRVRYFAPIGVHSDLLQQGSSLDGESYVSVRVFRDGTASNYFWAAGLAEQSFEGVSTAISFNANGGEGTMAEISDLLIGESVVLPQNTLLRSGYRFMGWNTEEDGSGDDYADGATVTIRPEMAGRFTLYAVWLEDKAVLDYGANVNIKLKKMAGTNAAYVTVSDSNIKAIKMANALPAGYDTDDDSHIVSDSNSPFPIYAWFDDSDGDNDSDGDGIIYLYSMASVVEGGENMSEMFYQMRSLSDITGLASLDVSNTVNIGHLFYYDFSLTNISPLANWDTSNVENMTGTFWSARSLSDLSPIAGRNTSKNKSLALTFDSTAITSVAALETKQHAGKNYISWDTSNVERMPDVFSGTSSLVDISALASWNTSKVTEMRSAFSGAASLADISSLANWDTSSVKTMDSMFYGARSLSDISPIATWNTSMVTDMGDMFYCTQITTAAALETKQHDGKNYVSWDISNVEDIWAMFWMTPITDISALASWDTSSVKDMRALFYGAQSLSNILPIADWDTSNVEDMRSMFEYATSLSDISPLSKWNTTKVTDIGFMFRATMITNVDALETKQHEGKNYVSWNISRVKSLRYTFYEARLLSDITALASWDTGNVTDMFKTFCDASSIGSLSPIFEWNVSRVTDMGDMFTGVPTAVTLPSWYH